MSLTFADWITSTLGTTALLTVLVFLSKNWIIERLKLSIKHEYDKDLEKHKADLKRDYDVQIETMKAEFAKNQFRFSHIFEKTADTIIKTYQLLVELREAVSINLGHAGNTDEKANKHREELFAKRMEVYRYLIKHKIYLSKATSQKIDEFTKKLIEIQITYEAHLRNRTPASNEKISDAMNSMFNVVPKLLEDLEADFQKTLGFQ